MGVHFPKKTFETTFFRTKNFKNFQSTLSHLSKSNAITSSKKNRISICLKKNGSTMQSICMNEKSTTICAQSRSKSKKAKAKIQYNPVYLPAKIKIKPKKIKHFSQPK